MRFREFIEVAGVLPTGEKVRPKDIKRLLAPYAKPWYYASYAYTEKPLGINPKYDWGFSPIAVYGYPVDKIMDAPELNDTFGVFANDRPLVTIFKVKESARDKILNVVEFDKAIADAIQPIDQAYLQKYPELMSYYYRDDFMGTLLYGPHAAMAEEWMQKRIDAAKKAHPLAPQVIDNYAGKISDVSFNRLFNSISRHYDTGFDPGGKNKQSLKYRKNYLKMGIRGIQVGPQEEGGKLPYEGIFFYPSDLETIHQFVNKRGYMGCTWVGDKCIPIKSGHSEPSIALPNKIRDIILGIPYAIRQGIFMDMGQKLNKLAGYLKAAGNKEELDKYKAMWNYHSKDLPPQFASQIAQINSLWEGNAI